MILFSSVYCVTIPCPHRCLFEMVEQPGKAETEEYIEEFGFITEENGTRV